jgi:hypothetical protein
MLQQIHSKIKKTAYQSKFSVSHKNYTFGSGDLRVPTNLIFELASKDMIFYMDFFVASTLLIKSVSGVQHVSCDYIQFS